MTASFDEYLAVMSGSGGGRAYMAAALLTSSFAGERWRWPELGRLRALLEPKRAELQAQARTVEGKRLITTGLTSREPMLVLASTAVDYDFARSGDRMTRMLMFASLAEVVASNPSMISARPVREVAGALRVEIKELGRNPTARCLLPDLRSPYDLLVWMPTAGDRYSRQVVAAWTRHVGPALLKSMRDVASASANHA